MDVNRKIYLAATLQGLAVFTALGICGVGENTIAHIFEQFGTSENTAFMLSKLVLGITASLSLVFWILGCAQELDGQIVEL